MRDRDAELDAWEASLGLPASCPQAVEVEATRLLTIAPEVVRAMSAVALGEAVYCLEQFAFFLQKAANREQARVRWAEENLRRLLGPLLGRQQAYSYEERRMLALAGNASARELDRLRVEAQTRLDRIQYQSRRIEGLARALLALQQTKRGRD
jgi:hypothetical protein